MIIKYAKMLNFLIITSFFLNCTPAPRYSNRQESASRRKRYYRTDNIVVTDFEPSGETYKVNSTFIWNCSFYGSKFHGRKTANGEVYDMYGLTAAHKELPFNTVLKVTNPDNNKSIEVRINDRGPFIKGRDLDLSYGAARKLDMVEEGVKYLNIEILAMD